MKQFILLLFLFSCHQLSSQTVNEFTGGFSYDYPVLTLPSNRGAPIGITASYNAGIQVNQKASEIGLGWSLNAGGEISRNVSGIPDDAKTYTAATFPAVADLGLNGSGSLYSEFSYGVSDYDFTKIKRGLDTAEFIVPDFDSYQLSGPGIYSTLDLSYLNFYQFGITSNNKVEPDQYQTLRKPQFHFTHEFADTLVSRHYSTTPINSGTAFKYPGDLITGLGYTNSAQSYVGKHLSGTTITNENFDISSGRLATPNFIEYFTNGEIDNGTYDSYAALNAQNNFIDYKSSHARSASDFPPDGIGYFRVTAANGLTYHYSLPVYEKGTTTYNIPLDNTYSVVSAITATDLPDSPGYEFLTHPSNSDFLVKSKTHNKIAVKWLLTAITGPDFVDNGNNIVDDADSGYWVSYDYRMWSSNFNERSPAYGYDHVFNPYTPTQHYPVYFPINKGMFSEPFKLAGLFGSVSITKSEVYYLSKIRTSSHTAIFLRDVRLDERSSDTSVTISGSFKPAPELFVRKVLLFKNEDIDGIISSYPPSSFNTSNYSDFSFAAVNNSGNFFNSEWFTQNYNAIYPYVLRNVSFSQDYSLCRKYHNNINTNCASSSVLSSPTDIETNLSVATYSASGKLTLNRIFTYGLGNAKVVPSVIFDYNANNSPGLSNPDFNPKKADYWGFYKSDATNNSYSRYTSSSSKNYTKVWSLLKITDPMGGKTELEYESNSYTRVIDNEIAGGTRGAAYIYRIRMATNVGISFNINLDEGNGSTNLLTEFSDFFSGNIGGLKGSVCMPYFHTTCYNSANCVSYSGGATHQKGFVFGDCTFTLNTPPPGSTYNVYGNVILPPSGFRHAYTLNDDERYIGWGTQGAQTTNSYSPLNNSIDVAYSGNGFLRFETPAGYEVYGSGIRVKRIKTRNSANEVYTTEYSYENGVATSEMDQFDFQILKTGGYGNVNRYSFLQPKSSSLFDLAPYVGYSKVTTKNMGQVNSPNGKIERTFVTLPTDESGLFSQNYSITTVANLGYSSSVPQFSVINECVNKFSNVFGKEKEARVFDKNDNMISRVISEYEPTDQGSLTESLCLRNFVYRGDQTVFTVNIFRDVLARLKSTTTYGAGSVSKVKTISRDEFTGEIVAVQREGQNETYANSFHIPAYKTYKVIEGLTFMDASFRRVLPVQENVYQFTNVDTSLTPLNGSGRSASFQSANYQLFSKLARQRQYNSGTGKFSNAQVTLPRYMNNRNFTFDAGQSSLNAYGLLTKADLYSNPLNLTAINDSVFWERSSGYNWKLVSEVTLLDQYKNAIEIRDGNNRFNASRFGYKGFYRNASVSNCNYPSFTFADFETSAPNSNDATIDGDILVYNPVFVDYTTLVPHTGSKCLQVSSNPVSFVSASEKSPSGTMETGLQSGRFYRASVWTHTTNLSNARLEIAINGTVANSSPYVINNTITASSSGNLVTTIGNWNLLQVDFEIPEKFITGATTPLKITLKSANNSAVYFDDFVFHPVESKFSGSVYDPRTGRMVSSIDDNGLATTFKYDATGRVTEVWKEIPGVGYRQIKKHMYNYARGAND